ncbi:retrovirus-related pol polyprotein from transposon TNT 1-94 [Tanacetum coccineum]|uniref:Retrovirus-related pol polyprotein from transposon TNT 1-94 n=1 Tax=Tanacetum coccineum TaxID=301880 RepID=A0ABQ5CT95_9ASTR
MTTLVEHMIVVGAENHPPVLKKSMYDSWKSHMLLCIQGDDPIACLNKAMAVMSTVMASRFPSTNNQLRTSSNPRNQATIQDGRGEGHMARQCNQPKRPRNSAWFKEKMLLDCDDISSTKAVLMANLSSYDSDVLLEVPQHDTYQNDDMINQSLQETQYFKQSLIDYVSDNDITSDSNIISYEQYLQETQIAIVQDTNSYAQQDAMIMFMFEQMFSQVTKCTEATKETQIANKTLTAELERYKERKARRIRPTLYDGIVISKKCDVVYVDDSEETLILAEESRLKMLEKQNDPISKEKKKQAFWLPISNPTSEQLVVPHTSVKIEVPKELPNVSLVNKSFQKLKNHLASFDEVVKDRITPTVITKDGWGFEHTKKVFLTEVIPFMNSLRESFKDFDNALHNEIYEVKTVFNQMEAAVEQCYVDKKYFDIQKKELFLDNDRLLEHIIRQDVINIVMHADVESAIVNNKFFVHDNLEIERLEQENDHLFELLLSQDIVYICVNSLATRSNFHEMKQSYIDEYNETLELKAQLAKKEHMIEKTVFNELALRCSRLENRDTHIDYIKHTQEHADTLREIVKHARALKPLHSDLDSVCKYVIRIQEVLVYVSATCPSLTKASEKLVAVTPLNKNKNVSSTSSSRSQLSGNTKKNMISRTTSSNQKNKVEDRLRSVKSSSNKNNRVNEPVCIANVKHSMLNVNSKLICVTCNECMFDVIHDLCVLDYVNNVNVRSKSKSGERSKKRKVNVGYRWIPTGRTLTTDGNRCPLTRITSTNVVPPKNLLPTKVTKKITPRKNNPEMLKDVTNISSSSSSKGVEFKISNNSEPNQNWGSNVSTTPSYPRVNFRFGNDQIAKIMGYGDYQIENVTISRVYYVEGLRHNLFSVGQFCDFDLEVAFRKYTSFVRNLEGVDLLKGSRGSNLYTLSIKDMMKSSPICLMSKASKTKSWLWHQRMSHLNFGTINQLAKQGLVRGLPKLKFKKDHLCSTSLLGKSKKHSHKPKSKDINQEKLSLLHMDLCRPMRVESINEKKYISVIVYDYSRFTWVKFLRSKDEAPEFIIKFMKRIQVCLNTTVRNIRTDNGTEFVNQTLHSYYEDVVPLFLCAEAVAIACYTQNRSLIRLLYVKTPYELLLDKKPNLTYFHVFGALCYPTNDCEDLGKLKPKADIGIFIGYAPEILFQPLFDEYFNPPPYVASLVPAVVAPEPANPIDTPSSTSIDQDAPFPSTSQTPQESQSPFIPSCVEEQFHDIEVVHVDNDPFFGVPIPEPNSKESSSRDVIPTNAHSINQPLEHLRK